MKEKEDNTLEAVNKEINRLSKKSLKRALTEVDIKKLEAFIRMRNILIDKPTKVYIDRYDNINDGQILETIVNKDPIVNRRKKKANTSKTAKPAKEPNKKH